MHVHRSAFTLVEILVSIAILATVAALLLPAVAVVRRAADTTVCASNLRQIGAALFIYSDDWDGRFPANNTGQCSSWPYIFGDWGTGAWGQGSTFYADYLPAGRRLYFCPTGLRWQRHGHGEISAGYHSFPSKAPGAWVAVTNYAYFAGPNETGKNSRNGPILASQAGPQRTLIGDVMRFGTSSPYTSVSLWNHTGGPARAGVKVLNDRSGGNLFFGDGHVGWIGGVEELLANRQKMKGNDGKSYAAVQIP